MHYLLFYEFVPDYIARRARFELRTCWQLGKRRRGGTHSCRRLCRSGRWCSIAVPMRLKGRTGAIRCIGSLRCWGSGNPLAYSRVVYCGWKRRDKSGSALNAGPENAAARTRAMNVSSESGGSDSKFRGQCMALVFF